MEGMVQSCDKLIMEIGAETGLDWMGEAYDKDEGDDEDGDEDNDRGDTAAPPTVAPKVIVEEEEDLEEMVPEQEAPEELEIMVPEEEPEPSQPCLFTMLMKDHEESSSRMFDDLDELDDPTHADYDVDE
jgi:hypothetical protein